jgi:hypothetical protein
MPAVAPPPTRPPLNPAPDAPSVVGPALPAPRGPLSAAVLAALGSSLGHGPDLAAAAIVAQSAEPLGDDAQLALYLCYELHYRGFAGVDPEWEWEPSLLALRAALERTFLARLREVAAAPAEDADDAGADLDALVRSLRVESPEGRSVSRHLLADGADWQARELAVHRSLYHLKEADPQAWVIPRLHGAAKAAVVAVEFDEYGAGSPLRAHARLFADLMEALGLHPGYGAYLDVVPAPMLAVVNLMSLCGLHRSLRGALVGQFATVEITSPPGSARMVAALERLGVGASATRFYAEHVEADAVHEQVLVRDVIGGLLAAEPDLAADVAFGIRASTWLEERLDEHMLTSWEAGRSSLLRPL